MGKQLEIERIRIDGGTQMREHIDYHAVADYAEAYKAGVDMPELVVFHDGSDYWLADGFHRYHAAKRADKPKVTCHVRPGSQREAILYAAGANDANGLRRTPEDKMIAVRRLLLDDEWGKRSDRWIAEHARVSHPFVGEQRKQLPQFSTGNDSSGRMDKRAGKDGREQPAKRITRKPSVAPHVPPIDEPLEIPFQDVGKAIGHNRTEALLQSGCAVLVDKFADEREWVRTLHDLVAAMRKKQSKLDYDKGDVVHTLTTVANELAEAIQSAEEAA